MTRCTIPGSAKSSVKLAAPVMSRGSSRLRIPEPKTLVLIVYSSWLRQPRGPHGQCCGNRCTGTYCLPIHGGSVDRRDSDLCEGVHVRPESFRACNNRIEGR